MAGQQGSINWLPYKTQRLIKKQYTVIVVTIIQYATNIMLQISTPSADTHTVNDCIPVFYWYTV